MSCAAQAFPTPRTNYSRSWSGLRPCIAVKAARSCTLVIRNRSGRNQTIVYVRFALKATVGDQNLIRS